MDIIWLLYISSEPGSHLNGLCAAALEGQDNLFAIQDCLTEMGYSL